MVLSPFCYHFGVLLLVQKFFRNDLLLRYIFIYRVLLEELQYGDCSWWDRNFV